MSSIILKHFIQKTSENLAECNGFSDYCVTATPSSVSGFGAGMLCIRINENDSDKEIRILCKTVPSEDILEACGVAMWMLCFHREVLFYDKIVPLFAKFQEEKSLPKEKRFLSYPKCHGTVCNNERKEYAILLEDLRPLGFNVWERPNSTQIEQLRLSMKELGKFHGLSFALKDQKPEHFADFKGLNNIVCMFLESESGLKIFQGFFDRAIESLKNVEHKNIMCDVKNNLVSYMDNCVNNETTHRFGVISHGDFHNNNILYKSNEHGIAEDIRILDWQTIRFASPVIDIVYSIFPSTEKSLRDQELHNLLQLYHNSLSEMVRLLGSDPDQLFTLNDMYDELKKCGNYALISAPVLTNVYQTCMMSKEEDKSFDQLNSGMNDTDGSQFDKRINEVVGDIVSFGLYTKRIFEDKK